MAKTIKTSKKIFRLSPRLKEIYESCLDQGPVWDVCCDHGLLGLYALMSGREVHFVDQAPHLILQLQNKCQKYFAEDLPRAHFWPADFTQFKGPVAGSVVVAGVGGHLIYKILQNLSAQLISPWRLVLCANRSPEQITLGVNDFFVGRAKVCSKKIMERGRERQILIVEGL